MATKTLGEHIEITPGVVGGKPRISGRRITVQNIAIWHERMGRSADEIATEYDLTLADVYAALAAPSGYSDGWISAGIASACNWCLSLISINLYRSRSSSLIRPRAISGSDPDRSAPA